MFLHQAHQELFAKSKFQKVEALIMTMPGGLEKMFLAIGTPSDKALPVRPEES